MRRYFVLAAILVGIFLGTKTYSQVSVSVNIGLQPVWGPVGYDHVEYYYMPDIDAYYYVPGHQYIYFEDGRWVFAAALPPRFSNFDLYHGYKVVINDPKPYLHADRYRAQYGRYKGRHDQPIIRESHDPKYFEIKEHPEHAKWHGNGHDEHDRGR